MPSDASPLIRPVCAQDDLARITALIHAAYAPHTAQGLRYWGTHQTVEDTAKRFAMGIGLGHSLGSCIDIRFYWLNYSSYQGSAT